MSIREYDKTPKYIDLKINGRLFPSWVNLNFKKYKLEEFFLKPGEDPCQQRTDKGEIKLELRKYQKFIGEYLDFRSPYNSILLYMGTGVGKTATAINIYNVLYNYTPGWNVFLLIKASIKGEWLDNLKKWLNKDDYDYRYKNIIFVHYDSPIADRKFMDAIKNVDSAKKSMYIVDEAHNFIRNVYSNISSDAGKRAQVIYDYIIQDKKENPDTRVILLSGTPAVNNPFELGLLFNMLRPGIFPRSENEFNQIFISSTTHQTLNPNTKNMFQRRIMGLVSYYMGATIDKYATKKINYIDVTMSDYQEDVYTYYEEIEKKMAASGRFSGKGGSTTYKVYTRQACNFVFPAISQKVNGELRPRPGKFRLSEKEAISLSEKGKVKDKDKSKLVHVSEYLNAVNLFINTFVNYLDDKYEADRRQGYTISDDVAKFLDKYNKDFEKFNNEEKQKSSLYDALYTSSPKMLNIVFNILTSPGPTVVYSNYVLMEGLQIFKIYLNYFDFYNYMETKELLKDRVGYVEFHGNIKTMEERMEGLRVYNLPENKYGQLIKVILISPAGSEGLNLMNVRQVHIMEPYWNEVRITQMIGRGIRQCSHKDLPIDQRHVDIYRYKSVRKNKNKFSTDQYIEDLARSKDSLIQSFLDAMREVAVDCQLNKNENMLTQEYKCFQFEEPSQFDKHIGPAYKEDMADDIKMDNGSNSIRAQTVRIKVMKVKAVRMTTPPDESGNAEYSKPEHYWYYSKNGSIYDYDLHFPVGKVAMDENGTAVKLDKDTYIIDYMIPIPTFD